MISPYVEKNEAYMTVVTDYEQKRREQLRHKTEEANAHIIAMFLSIPPNPQPLILPSVQDPRQ